MFLFKNVFFSIIPNKTSTVYIVSVCFAGVYFAAGLMNGADGFYSEASGAKATDFVIKKTQWFTDYFNIGPTLTDQDMRTWANSIVGEIQIEREGEEAKAINELIAELRNNIRNNRKEYSNVVERFIKHIREIENERITSH